MGWFFLIVGALVGVGMTAYGTMWAQGKFYTWAYIVAGALLGNLLQWIGIAENIIERGWWW